MTLYCAKVQYFCCGIWHILLPLTAENLLKLIDLLGNEEVNAEIDRLFYLHTGGKEEANRCYLQYITNVDSTAEVIELAKIAPITYRDCSCGCCEQEQPFVHLFTKNILHEPKYVLKIIRLVRRLIELTGFYKLELFSLVKCSENYLCYDIHFWHDWDNIEISVDSEEIRDYILKLLEEAGYEIEWLEPVDLAKPEW